MRPIAYAEAAKPDFVGADGKTYRYDPVKKSWYVIKEAETKDVNAGVKTLMNDGAGGNVNTPSPFDNPGGVRVTPEMSLPVAFLAGKISSAFAGPRQGPAAPVEDREATPVGFSSPTANFGKESTIPTGGIVSPGVTDTGFVNSQISTQADRDAVSGKSDKGSSVSLSDGYSPGTEGSPSRDSNTAEGEANGGMVGHYAQGGLGSLGGYSDGGRLLRGPGDGVSDSIPATVGDRQPARLADGEFVVPARIVSELGNGSTEAGARALYKMMDRIQANRRKTTGKNSVAVNSKSHKYLPA